MPTAYASTIIDAPVNEVWAVVRDFNGLPTWLDVVAESHIEDDLRSDQIGCIRNFTLHDGKIVREQLLELHDEGPMWFTYKILESPHNVENYVARFRCFAVTDQPRCFVEWGVRFDCLDLGETDHFVAFFPNEVYIPGFNAIKKAVAS